MWRSELYATEVCQEPPSRKYALPVYTAPIVGEALLSWLCRLAAMNGQSPFAFSRQAFGISDIDQPEWWRRPTADQRAKLLAPGGLTPEQLSEMTLEGYSVARRDEDDKRFARSRAVSPKWGAKPGRTLLICGACLDEDATPHLRREWLIGWQAVCSRHQQVLMRNCPHCKWKLSSQWLRGNAPVDFRSCRRCGGLLAASSGATAIAAVIELQEVMLTAKRTGNGNIPGLGLTQWETFTAIADIVIQAFWVNSDAHACKALLTRIASDFALAPTEQSKVDWRGNYGALVLLAWLFADWPHRLRHMLEQLDAPRIDDVLNGFQAFEAELQMRVRMQLNAVLDYRPRPANWQQWLSSLAEGGTDFRKLAGQIDEREWQRKRRFIALSVLSEGQTLKDAEIAARASTNMIMRWLEIGMTHGIEAIIEQPLRICDLAPAQIEEITAWLRSSERITANLMIGSRERARSAIMTRFGLRITTHTAYQLMRRAGRRRTPL